MSHGPDAAVTIHRGRTQPVVFRFATTPTDGAYYAQVRDTRDPASTLIVEFASVTVNGNDLTATLTAASTANVAESAGVMDVLRVDNGIPHSVLAEPVTVRFVDMPTVQP